MSANAAMLDEGGTHEERLAQFAVDILLDEVPPEVVARAKLLILDNIGVQLACSVLPWVERVRDYAAANSRPGAATVVGYDLSLAGEWAALVNGTSGHGFEADDYCPVASAHAGCVVLPASLATAQEVGSSGAEFLTSFIVGAETVVRMARATMPPMLYERGFHETCAHGVFGSALASGRLLGLDAHKQVMAIGIASSYASGTSEFVNSGGQTKRLHGGLGAAGGVRAAGMARHGITGPSRGLTGSLGFLHAFAPKPKPDWLVQGLGTEWQLMELVIKPYCCAGRITPEIDALRELVEAHALQPEDIVRVRVGADRGVFAHANPLGDEAAIDALAAQFNHRISLAIYLIRGRNDFATYKEILDQGQLTDERILEMSKRIELYVDPDCDAAYPGAFKCLVEVECSDGRRLEARATSSRDHQPSAAQILDKFRSFAKTRLTPDAADRVISAVNNLESLESVNEIAAILGGGR